MKISHTAHTMVYGLRQHGAVFLNGQQIGTLAEPLKIQYGKPWLADLIEHVQQEYTKHFPEG